MALGLAAAARHASARCGEVGWGGILCCCEMRLGVARPMLDLRVFGFLGLQFPCSFSPSPSFSFPLGPILGQEPFD